MYNCKKCGSDDYREEYAESLGVIDNVEVMLPEPFSVCNDCGNDFYTQEQKDFAKKACKEAFERIQSGG